VRQQVLDDGVVVELEVLRDMPNWSEFNAEHEVVDTVDRVEPPFTDTFHWPLPFASLAET
jgi:hypothetical protein